MPRAKKLIVVDVPAEKVTQEKIKPATNSHGYAWLTWEMVGLVFIDARAEMKRGDIAEKYNISLSSVSTILGSPEWFVNRMTKYAAAAGATDWVYPEKLARKSTVEAEV